MAGSGQIVFTWVDPQGNTRVLTFSSVLRENHTDVNEGTKYTVEEGTPITDHVRVQPRTLAFEVYVGEFPEEGLSVRSYALNIPRAPSTLNSLISTGINTVSNALGLSSAVAEPRSIDLLVGEPGDDPVKEVLDTLDEMCGRVDGVPPAKVSITGTKRDYRGFFYLRSASSSRDASVGGGMNVSIECEQIRFAQLRTVPTPKPSAIKATKKKAKGTQNTTQVTNPAKKDSILYANGGDKLVKAITGAGG